MTYRARILVLIGLLGLPSRVFAQVTPPVLVHDPLNALHLIQSVSQQVTQITNQATQIRQTAANLKNYSTVGGWVDLSTRLTNLQNVVKNAAAQHKISGSVADAQISQMSQEIATLNTLQRLANGSGGALQAQSASTRLQAELVTQLQEQRQLTLAQIKQQQLAEQEAIKRYYGPSTPPDQY